MSSTSMVLINGIPVIHHPTGSPITSVRVVVNAGSIHESVPGTAHFLEHMFFKGSEARDYEKMNRLVAQLGNTNAYTANHRTVFLIETTEDKTFEALDLLLEMLFQPRMDKDEFEKERGVILEEFQAGEDNPIQYLFRNAEELVLGSNGRPIIGTRESLNSITVDDLIQFRQSFYTRQNFAITIVGGRATPTRNLISAVAPRLASYDHLILDGVENIVPNSGVDLGPWDAPKTHRLTHKAEQAGLTLWMPWVSMGMDRQMGFASQIFLNMVGEGMHSLFFDRLREKSGLCYATGAFVDETWDQKALVGYALLAPENVPAAVKGMQEILEDVAAGNFDDELLDVAFANNKFSLASSVEKAAGWAMQFSDHFFYFRKVGLIPEIFDGVDFVLEKMGDQRGSLRTHIQTLARTAIQGATIVTTNA